MKMMFDDFVTENQLDLYELKLQLVLSNEVY